MIKGTESILIGDLISRRVPFFVPKYQRNYAWASDEVDDFIDDIAHLYDGRTPGQVISQKHFFGGLVSIDTFVPNSMTGRIFELVDGQQRMATFIIVIGLIQRTFLQIAQEATLIGDQATRDSATAQAQLTLQNYLKYQEVVNNNIQYRLRVSLSRVDSLYFQQMIDGIAPAPNRDSHDKLKFAQDRINERLIRGKILVNGVAPDGRLASLLRLQACIFEDCHIIHIYSDDKQEAYRLFRILNDRGRPIGDADKLRSHTLELLEGNQQLQDLVEQQWDEVLSLEQAAVDGFLQAFFTASTGEKPVKRELFDHFVKKIFTPPNNQVNIQQFIASKVGEIQSAKEHYLAISDGEWPYAQPIESAWKRDRLTRLMKVLRHTLCIPLLLAVRSGMNENVFSEVVMLLERFAFRYVSIVGGHHNPPNTAYGNIIKSLRANPAAFSSNVLAVELRNLVQVYAADTVFETNLFNKLDYRQIPQRRLIKHFLTTLEDCRGWIGGGGVGLLIADETRILDVSTNTIEHIYPQNPSAVDIDVQLEPVKQLLANLSFWGSGENQAAGNLPFNAKRPRYNASIISANRDLAQLGVWDFASYSARRVQLWNAAQLVFRI
jgi:hypothetical protein